MVNSAVDPLGCPIERAKEIYQRLATIRLQAAAGDCEQLRQLARGAELQVLALLADLRLQVRKTGPA